MDRNTSIIESLMLRLKSIPTNTKVFLRVYEYVEKVDLSKGYHNPKRKSGATAHFSGAIEHKFEKKSHKFSVF